MQIIKTFINRLATTTIAAAATVAILISFVLATSFTPVSIIDSAYADPPGWAPAHGYRNKKDKKHKYKRGYGESAEVTMDAQTYIENGTCNREAVGNVIGGIVGGVAGSQIGGGDGKKLATAAGALIGWIVGGNIGKFMDDADHYCTGQALSHSPDGRPVEWSNPDEDATYKVTPTRTMESDTSYCREYTTEATIGGNTQKTYGMACRQEDGSWKVKS